MSEQPPAPTTDAPVDALADARGSVAALRASHDRLRTLVEPLDATQVEAQAYPTEWSIAQVLSHLGSGAEIFGSFVEAGVRGEEPPGPDAFPPVWEAWNAKSPPAQVADALVADLAFVERFDAMDDDQLASLRLAVFGMDLDAAALVRMRLSEHALHTWDVAVALDPEATVAPDAVDRLVDLVTQFAARAGKPLDRPLRVALIVSAPERRFVLDVGDAVTVTESDGAGDDQGLPQLRLPAEALLRLVYGRLDPAHTPESVEAHGVDLDELRRVFPGV